MPQTECSRAVYRLVSADVADRPSNNDLVLRPYTAFRYLERLVAVLEMRAVESATFCMTSATLRGIRSK